MNDLDPSVVRRTDDDAPIPSESEHDAALRILTEQLPTIMWKTDAELRVTSVSGQAEHSLEADRASYVGRTIPEIFNADETAPAVTAHRRALQGDRASYALEFGGRTLQCHLEPLRDADGSITGALGIALDVTEWTQAREELATTQARYRALIEHLPAVVFIDELDDATTPVYMSPQVEELVGYTADEWLADPALWNRLLHPADRERVEAKLREHIQTGVPLIEEYRMIHRDGRTLWVHDEARIVGGEDGTPRFSQGFLQDITARKRAEAGLRRTVRQFRSLIENALDVIAVLEEDLTFRYGSPSLERVVGRRPEELIGRSIVELLHPEDAPLVQESSQWGLAHPGETIGLEVRVRHRDGTWRVLEGIAVNLLEEPAIGGIVVNARDITERKRSEDRLRFLARASGVLASSLDLGETLDQLARLPVPALADWSVLVLVNEDGSCGPIFHAHVDPRKEELARVVSDRYPANIDEHPALREAVREGRSQLIQDVAPEVVDAAARDDEHRRALRELGIRSLMIVPLAARGRSLGVNILVSSESGRRFDAHDLELAEELAHRAALAVDNARLFETARESEERFRQLVEGVRDYAIFMLDPDGRIASWHPTAERTFGYRDDEVIGQPVSILYGKEDALVERAQQTIEQAAEAGSVEEEGWRVRKDGTRFWAVATTTAIRDAEGRLRGFSRMTRDITERKQAQERLKRSFEMLQRSDAERRRVLGRLVEAQEEERERIAVDIHDDSLQVMVAVGMRLEMLERMIRDDDARADLDQLREVVGESIKRLRTLLFEVRPPVLDTEGLAAALRVYARQMRVETGIEPAIEERLSEEPPGEIGTIAYRIAAEALQNVKKHARANSVTVLLDDDDGGLRVRVVDDGVGFSKQDLEGRLPGHLGLATMRERAEVAGGWCRIESAPDQGTTVEFWLPVSRHNLSRAS